MTEKNVYVERAYESELLTVGFFSFIFFYIFQLSDYPLRASSHPSHCQQGLSVIATLIAHRITLFETCTLVFQRGVQRPRGALEGVPVGFPMK